MILEYNSGHITAKLERSGKLLVDDVSFSLDKGKSLALIGETGSGKTMTAMAIMGLLPSNVSVEGGQMLFRGEGLLTKKKIRSLLGVEIVYIPQNGLEFLNPSERVRNQLYDGMKKLGIKRARREQLALEKLSAVGFEHPEQVLDKYPFQLSGGMAQRVTIAIAACSDAKLVIADEPTNGLDYEAKVRFMAMLNTIFPEAARLIITHDIGVAELCDNTLVLCGGKMMEKGPSKVILTSPRHPYTKALIHALVKNGMKETPILRRGMSACPFYKRCPQATEGCFCGPQQSDNREWWCSNEI